jgi:hypothetical protein
MITNEILEAAFKGQIVEYFNPLNKIWTVLEATDHFSFYFYTNTKFRIKPIPYKKEHEVWLDKVPTSEGNCLNLENNFLGFRVDWAFSKTDSCNKKFKITVEEVEDV